jgi:2-C-methyl-D-erythritol 2,4-cyclodiphosphate synthase
VTSDGGGSPVRVGFGFDSHPFSDDPDRPLWLGGVRFDGASGLAGHSDGDVVCHAVADALLGAAAAGDIGEHFPDTDPAFEGITGIALVVAIVAIVRDRGLHPSTCDATVLAASPAIGPRRKEMREALAAALGVDVGDVSVKATRPEGLGLTADGIGCMALVTAARADA